MPPFLVALIIAGAVAIGGSRALAPAAVQTPYRDGVPHTDRSGGLRMTFAAGKSFLPIGIYHGLTGDHFGRSYDLSVLAAAGFNAVHLWEGQTLASALPGVRAAGLQLVYANPSDEEAAAHAGDPAILAWYLEHEPSRAPAAGDAARLDSFRARRSRIEALDPDRATLVIDVPPGHGPGDARWDAWNSAAAISAHFNYPLRARPLRSLGEPGGIADSVARAVALNGGRKPVWFVVQAFANPPNAWRLPTAHELRAMTYAALVHGATGIFVFAFDSFATRDGQVLGIAPDPPPDYGPTPDYDGDGRPNLVAGAEDLRRAQALWAALPALTAELRRLAPALLSPTSREPYRVEVVSGGHTAAPVRTLLKQDPEGAVLIAVNLDAAEVEAVMEFDRPQAMPAAPFGGARPDVETPSRWRLKFAPLDVRVLTLTPEPQG